jgi:hypothetical protein
MLTASCFACGGVDPDTGDVAVPEASPDGETDGGMSDGGTSDGGTSDG